MIAAFKMFLSMDVQGIEGSCAGKGDKFGIIFDMDLVDRRTSFCAVLCSTFNPKINFSTDQGGSIKLFLEGLKGINYIFTE